MNNETNDHVKAVGYSWWYWSLAIGMILATMAVFTGVEPWFINRQNITTRASLSYISTHQGILRQLKTSYDGIATRLADVPNDAEHAELRRGLVNQQRSILLQMRQEADTIPRDVPDDIRSILNQ